MSYPSNFEPEKFDPDSELAIELSRDHRFMQSIQTMREQLFDRLMNHTDYEQFDHEREDREPLGSWGREDDGA